MRYEVILRPAAQKQLDEIKGADYQKIDKAISSLENDPRPKKVKKLTDIGLWRIRIGHYRVVYAIDDDAKLVIVVRIARREEDT